MTGIFDTHAHYDDEAYNEDREEVLRELPSQGILRVVNIGAGIASCKSTMELMERYDFIYGAMGIHPQETKGLNEEVITWLKEQCGRKKCVAVGEIGLDYYWDEPQRQVQKKWFARQLALAKEMSLPVVIHSREAAEDTIDIMRAEKAGETGGVIHCYSYSRETARRFLDMGFYFGLAPEPNRGKRNSSLNLPYVAAALAQLKGVSEEEVRRAAWENGMRLYRMEQSANS